MIRTLFDNLQSRPGRGLFLLAEHPELDLRPSPEALEEIRRLEEAHAEAAHQARSILVD